MSTATYFDRRYQVFLSSTYTDLREERRGVMQAVLEMDCFPAGMELFPAADDTAWEYIKKVIEESDYYLVVIGARYGSRDDSGLSFTEREYDYAIELGKPVLGFLHSDPSTIPLGKADLSEHDRLALEAFRNKVKRKLCDHWASSDELKAKVFAGINRLKKSRPAGGWVRAGDVPAAQLELELERARRELAETRSELQALQDKVRQDAQAALLPAPKAWGEATTIDVEVDGTEKRLVQLTTTWDTIFTWIGPRLADRAMGAKAWRTQLSRFAAEHMDLEEEAQVAITQRHADRVAWQFRAIGVLQNNYGNWILTSEGWEALDYLLVEQTEESVRDEHTTIDTSLTPPHAPPDPPS